MNLDNPWIHGLVYGLPLIVIIMGVAAYATWYERRFSAQLQNRVGPIHVGPQGLLQPIADGLRLLQNEDIVPRAADKALFYLAPVFPIFLVLATAAVIPWHGSRNVDGAWQNALIVADLDVGLLWVLGIAGLMVFPTWMAGWAAGNKWTMLAAMRSVAQGISYEIPLVVAAIVPVIATGELSLSGMVSWQADHGWIVWAVPGPGLFAFLLFFLTSLAEANRIPFDIPEAESELIGGVIVEYTGIKFSIFMLSEYAHTFVISVLAAVLFLGGAHGPAGLGLLWLLIKSSLIFGLIYWIRWSWFRYRSDQLMNLCWRWLVPISLFLLMATALEVYGGLL